jgi:hypothetical protein
MSAEKQHKPNSGCLFPNSVKWQEAKPGRPDFGGEAQVQCSHCANVSRLRVAGWHKQRPDGTEFISLAFSEPQPKKGPA